ncbi:hypothetical protein A9267_14190 [Shewanella sp. UCD-FRSSP16_17]|uniref:hypothetical protein n=1 Tax=Shewanella sp. UCD-FRSSP16_17 TaxID=1853256 RepID=UPI0007EEE06C|nr:hypothetical protein [Shewanella sp. UCD-FRSSP16_17]OBT07020.1 hypothetical protein A9267_14190 [Shewanella sp. UCD-FRSSP16_17]
MGIENIDISESVPKLKYVAPVVSAIMASVFCYGILSILLSFVLFPFENIEEVGPRYIAIFLGIWPVIGVGVGLSFGRLWARKVVCGIVIATLLVSLVSIAVVMSSAVSGSSGNNQLSFVIGCGLCSVLALLICFSKRVSTSLHVMRRHRRRRQKTVDYIKKNLERNT